MKKILLIMTLLIMSSCHKNICPKFKILYNYNIVSISTVLKNS